jgi:hypothetical protein
MATAAGPDGRGRPPEGRSSGPASRVRTTAGLNAGQLIDLAERLAALDPDVTNSDVPDARKYLFLMIGALEEEAGRRAIRELLGS